MAKPFLIGGVVALLGLLAGAFVGTLYAGNYAQDFEFLGVRGYEAGMRVGGLIGLGVGGLVGALFGVRAMRR